MNTRVLVADDDFDNRTIVQEILEASGIDVQLVADGETALAQAKRDKPDVLLLDLSMPKMSGWEVAKRLRQDPSMDGTAIIAFTAHALIGDELKAKASGCDDYLSKPCLPREVVEKVQRWAKRRSSEAA